jgi:hypothetical protein
MEYKMYESTPKENAREIDLSHAEITIEMRVLDTDNGRGITKKDWIRRPAAPNKEKYALAALVFKI